MIAHQLRNRNENFLRILERGIFAYPESPYRRLLDHAGVEFEAVARWVRQDGVEGALERLYEMGVYVTLDEVKGRRPIQRPGLEFSVRARDFDNPLSAKQYELSTGGSRGAATRILVDFDLLAHEAAYHHLFLTAFDMATRPIGVWFPVPPGSAAMTIVLRYAKLGVPVERWFSQNRLRPGLKTWKHFLFTIYAVYGSRLFGTALPAPEYMPLERASEVALWLAKKKAARPVLYTYASSGVRVCLAAKEQGLDISGALFRLAGEPYTAAKAEVLSRAGCRVVTEYAMTEIGRIGIVCAAPSVLDDVHLASDKLAVIQRDKAVDDRGLTVRALCYTSLLPSSGKIMLNFVSGDYGVLEERECGCPVGEVGFRRHLHTIRSYDKLTSEGMTFLGEELIALLEETLPARFGGHPTDYQFVEEEENGLPKVSIVVSPRVGKVNEEDIVATALKVLGARSGAQKMMAECWREGNTLRVVRREPYATATARILPLHILGGRES